MASSHDAAGYFRSGLPYNRFGRGPRTIVILQGLEFANKPLTPSAARFRLSMFRFLEHDYTAYVVGRRPGLPVGYSMGDMATDYAMTIREEFGGAVDVLGTSTGGSIALHLAADHPEVVGRLVIHSAAHSLGAAGKEAQMRTARLAQQGRWRAASAALLEAMLLPRPRSRALAWLGSLVMSLNAPDDPSDLVVTVEAEDVHTFKGRLHEIAAPTLVVAGALDPLYPAALVRETAEGIPNARLILYDGEGHGVTGKAFERDVLAFLREGDATAGASEAGTHRT